MLNPEMNRHLIEKGYVTHQLLSESEVQYLMDEVCKVFPEKNFLQKDGSSPERGITTSYVDSDIELREKLSNIIRNTLSPHIQSLLDGYRILACGLFVKSPKGGWLDLHYHPTVVEDSKHWVIDIWCPLQATDFSNGTFCAVPESHRIFPMTIDISPQEPPFYHSYAEEIRNHYSVVIPAKAGEAVLFEDSLLHWSPENLTDSPRYAIHCTCIPSDASPVCVYLNQVYPSYFDMFEVDDQFFIERNSLKKQDNLKLLKVLPDSNQTYTFEEFKWRIANAEKIRI